MGMRSALISATALLLVTRSDASLSPGPTFFWGAAFSAHQVEGGNDRSDWWDWEHTPGKIARGETTQTATDHYHRYPEDFDLAQSLGLNSVRLSVSWSRIEPTPGKFDEAELAHYRDVVVALRQRGIEPVIALQHFVHPRWFPKMGGWLSPESPAIFERFATQVAQALSPHVAIWITFNEPMIQIVDGFLKGDYPPAISDLNSTTIAFRHILAAHGLASRVLRRFLPPRTKQLPISGVGLALNMNEFTPAHDPGTRDGQEDLRAIAVLKHLSQWAFLTAVQNGKLEYEIPSIPALKKGFHESISIPEAAHSVDWIGVNYYSRYQIARDARNSLGIRWIIPPGGLIYASGLRDLLKQTRDRLSDPIPLVVSENGLNDAKDQLRAPFIQDHLEAVAQARRAGVDVRGYWHWSLTDNFEWDSGFAPRFGLVEVDYATQRRTVRASAWNYREYLLAHPEGPQ